MFGSSFMCKKIYMFCCILVPIFWVIVSETYVCFWREHLSPWSKSQKLTYLPKCHQAWFGPNRRCLIAHHVGNRQPWSRTIAWQNTTSRNYLIHPCTTLFLRWTWIWIKVEVCNWIAQGIFDTVEFNIIIPNLLNNK
jgi:hypothetical protein